MLYLTSYSLENGVKMKVQNGQKVHVHYKGTLKDGTVFDESRARGKTLSFTVGGGRMLKGFNDTVLGMGEGEVRSVTIEPEDAYGFHDSGALQAVDKGHFGEGFEFKIGEIVQGNGPRGPFVARIHTVEGDNVVLDFNHPLAGEQLQFEIELVSFDSWNLKMKKAELLEAAELQGIEIPSRATKAQILEALSA